MGHVSFSDAHPKRRLALTLTISVVAMLTAAVLPAATAGASTGGWQVVASGLDNPRGIDPGPLGSLVLSEAGRGGTDCQQGADPDTGEPVTNCLGNTGAVDLLWGGHTFKLASLPSIAHADGSSAAGPTHATFGRSGLLISMMGVEPLPYQGDISNFGKLLKLGVRGTSVVADPGAFEATANPDGNQIDSDPYGLAPDSRGSVMARSRCWPPCRLKMPSHRRSSGCRPGPPSPLSPFPPRSPRGLTMRGTWAS